jgi:UDP-N-acetylmuramoylalanine--D-glutamate ligase
LDLGGSGRATAHALMAGGATVTAWDDNADSRAEAANENIPLADLARPRTGPIYLALVLSPGIPLTHPQPHEVVERRPQCGAPGYRRYRIAGGE